MNNNLLNTKQVCQKLGISRVTVHKMVQEGKIKVVRLSTRANRYLESDIEKFIKDSRKGN